MVARLKLEQSGCSGRWGHCGYPGPHAAERGGLGSCGGLKLPPLSAETFFRPCPPPPQVEGCKGKKMPPPSGMLADLLNLAPGPPVGCTRLLELRHFLASRSVPAHQSGYAAS